MYYSFHFHLISWQVSSPQKDQPVYMATPWHAIDSVIKCYLTRAGSSPVSDLGQEVLSVVCRVAGGVVRLSSFSVSALFWQRFCEQSDPAYP